MIDELQRLLDEAGLEWRSCGDDGFVYRADEYVHFAWTDGERVYKVYRFNTDDGTLCIDGITPEQAIAATLGSGTCHITDNGPWGYPYVCSECGAAYDPDVLNGEFNFCPNCGRHVEVDE